MKDEIVHYEEIHQARRDGLNESANAVLTPHQQVQDSSANSETIGKDVEVLMLSASDIEIPQP